MTSGRALRANDNLVNGVLVLCVSIAGWSSLTLGCSADESLGSQDKPAKPSPSAEQTDSGEMLPGAALVVEVRGDTPTYVELLTPSELETEADEPPSKWDLVFRGLQIFTNGGSSGKGVGAAFGPGDPLDFLFTDAPDVPFLRSDRAGGAFLNWYVYQGAGHSLWSRAHVYGVMSGERYWKLQILGYYGERLGAPTSALYQLRYASVGQGQAGDTVAVEDLDAIAGGTIEDEAEPSGCLNLDTGERLALTPNEASERDDWHLCFRRDAVSVNNAPSGPGDVVAVDLDADETAGESIEQVQALTADGVEPRFDAVDYAEVSDPGLDYIEDGIVSAFGDRWYDREGDRIIPVEGSWFVRSADARHYYLVIFRSIEALPKAAGYRIEMRVREVE